LAGDRSDPQPLWCSFYGDVPASIEYPECTVSDAVRSAETRHPDAVALEFLGVTTTYRALGRQIEEAARALAALGLAAGDRLMIAMPTSPQAIVAYYAANSIGVVPAMVHPLATAPELEALARLSRSRVAVGLDALYARFTRALDTGALQTLILTRLSDALTPLKRIGFWMSRGRRIPAVPPEPRVHWWTELLAHSHAPAPRPAGKGHALSTILFSGGTTGMPKGIMLSDRNLISNGLQVARWVDMREGDRVLAALPLFHGFGLSTLVNAPLMSGCRVILVPEFSPKTIARLIRHSRPNFMAGVPSLYEALTRQGALKGIDLSCIEAAFSGGDMLPPQVKQRFDQVLAAGGSHARVLEGYGLTENVTGVTVMPLHVERAGSVGVPLPDTLVAICEPESSRELSIGQAGEICVSGPSVMLGYLDDPATTAATLRRHDNGRIWLHTGDIGRRDEDGFFYFLARRKRMIKSSGFNVFPGEVEQVLRAHPGVAEAHVVGVPDESRGERVKAYVVTTAPDSATPELAAELIEHCRRQLIKWSCPREIEFRRDLPKNRVGKVDERALLGSDSGSRSTPR
jgi:long-chain acyl-CoA synthetase